jgi:hypothetical protein
MIGNETPVHDAGDILHGWKAICKFAGMTKREIRASAGFPVFRTSSGYKSLRTQIEAWMAERLKSVKAENDAKR